MHRLPVWALTLGLIAGTHSVSAQPQQGTLTLTVQSEGVPVRGAKTALLIGSNAMNFPVTDATGGTSAMIKTEELVNEYAEVWVDQCGNEAPQIYLLAKKAKPPEVQAGCLRHTAGFFILRGDGPWQVTTDVKLLTVRISGPLPPMPPSAPEEKVTGEHHLWWQPSLGAGLNFFPGISDSCAAVIAIEPGATCSAGDKTVGFLVNLSMNYSIVGAEGGYWRATENRLSSSAVLNGTPSTLVSTYDPLGFYVAGVVHLPASRHLSFEPKAGATFWRVDLTQRQTVGSGAPSSTSQTLTGTSPFLGGSVETMISDQVGVGADYVYLRLRQQPVLNQDNHMLFFHLVFRFGRGRP